MNAHTPNLNDPRPARDPAELEQAAAEGDMHAALWDADRMLVLAALNRGDANAFCDFAPEVTDYARAPRGPMGLPIYLNAPTRRPQLHEVIQSILLPDSFKQPGLSELVQLALNAASGRFGADALREQANQLIGSWSVLYADERAEIRGRQS